MDKRVAIDRIAFTLNGAEVVARPLPGARLSSLLREELGARDVKVGCDAGDCGACTVLLDGAPVCACLTAAHQADGRHVETLAGLAAHDPQTQRLIARFEAHGAAQCGICTPGMLVAATALLREDTAPTETRAADALGGVLCRCTGYRKILDAVCDVAPVGSPARDGSVGTSRPGSMLRARRTAPSFSATTWPRPAHWKSG
jgi:aldehyde oxidoreductase